ncbi:MAG TPA: hypothetical protein VE504_00665 [Nitrososphaeraceae archaeon]|nr:hypothetical protein [Nitrososphaeraceae archaeon]
MSSYLGTFVLDFMSTDFKTDTDTATALLSQLKEECGFDKSLEAFAILDPVQSAGWIFSKLFIAGQFVEKLYEINYTTIENSKGKKFPDKFVFWLCIKLKERGCRAQIKLSK